MTDLDLGHISAFGANATSIFDWVDYDPVLSFETVRVAYFALNFSITGFLACMGIVSNSIILIVFIKMGFKETSNITMTSIAVWDLVKSVVMLVERLDWFMNFAPLSWFYSFTMVNGYLSPPVVKAATDVSTMLGAYVAIERCLCVSVPFTVRSLLTRKVVTITCLAISVVVGSSSLFYFKGTNIVLVDDPSLNISYLYVYPGPQPDWFGYYISVRIRIYPIVSVCIMTVCTAVIVFHLKRSSKFRSKISGDGSMAGSSRDRKIIRMLLVVIAFYLLFIIPTVIHDSMLKIFQEYSTMEYSNVRLICQYVLSFLSVVSSSVNIVIFYFMSSEFKRTMNTIFHLPTKKL